MKLKNYIFPLILLSSAILGGIAGYQELININYLKPIGDVFINAIFILVYPLIFFSQSSAITQINSGKQLYRLFFWTIAVFLFTSLVAAVYMITIVKLFPLNSIKPTFNLADTPNIFEIRHITIKTFLTLLFHNHMLMIIFISIITGLILSYYKKGIKLFKIAEKISIKLFSFVMLYAPVAFFAFFAVLVSEIGPAIASHYLQVTILYYGAALIYFIIGFSFYAYLAGKIAGVKLFWKNIFLSVITSFSTCSSTASIPANLKTANEMGLSPLIYETVIPLGAMIHKDGSVLGGVVKIAFLFAFFHQPFAGVSILLTALMVAILVGVVMGAIPSGGMLGELLILNMYGFPPSALMIIVAISLIIDPLATMLNVTGDIVACQLISKYQNNVDA